jgi:branched-chain amino acid aminotransferase
MSMIEADVVWMNGRLVPFAEARIHVITFGLHYGMAVFEGVRCYRRADGRSAVFRLREHIDRLLVSSAIACIDVPYDAAALEAACLETLRANQLAEAYLRPLVYVGAGALGMGSLVNPNDVAIIAWPFAPPLGEEGIKSGVRVHVSSFVRGHLDHTMSKAKISGQYVNSVLAKREAQRLGYDEAIMLDGEGRLTEATAQNIFVVYKGRLHTPGLEMAILDGITRDSVLALARDAGIEVVERSMTRDMLFAASEIFLTGTATEVTPVREVDGRKVGNGEPGPITKKLQAAFYTAVRGPGTPHPEWLTWL